MPNCRWSSIDELLGDQPNIVRTADQAFEQSSRVVLAALEMVDVDQPEVGRDQRAFLPFETVVRFRGLVTQDQAIAAQALLDRGDGADHFRIVGREKADQRNPQIGGIKSLVVVGSHECIARPVEAFL